MIVHSTMIHYTKDEVVEVIHSQSRIPAMDNLAPRLREEVFDMGDAVVYQGVAQFPARIKCATLAWKASLKALVGEEDE